MYLPLHLHNPKKLLQWLIKFLTTAPLAALVLMSAPWKLSPKATFIKSIPMFAPTVVRVPMFAPLKQSILRKHNQVKQIQKSLSSVDGLFFES
jgi:predicted alpha/beta-fold hydrolase